MRGAIDYAQEHGAQVIEGYPIDMQTDKLASETQLIMRYTVNDAR